MSPMCDHVRRRALFYPCQIASTLLFLPGLLNRYGGTSADAQFQFLISLIFCLLIKCSVCV